MTTSVDHWGAAPTWLMTPASAPQRFERAASSGADVVLFDLEDSVAPGDKDTARAEALGYVRPARRSFGPVFGLRINALTTRDGLLDLLALQEHGSPQVVLVPKVEAARDIELVASHLGVTPSQRTVWALIESPRAVVHLPDILAAPALGGVVFGAADYAVAAGCRRDNHALLYPRCALLAAARAADLPAVDSPFFDLDDHDGLRRDAQQAYDLGFVGMGAVHPDQLDAIRDAFTPSATDLAAAQMITAAAGDTPGGIARVAGRMVGPPMVAAAQGLIRRSVRASPLPERGAVGDDSRTGVATAASDSPAGNQEETR